MSVQSAFSGLVLAAILALPATAQSTGLQVSLIPAGTRAIMVDSKGKSAVWWFLGQQGDVWVAELRGGTGNFLRTEHYNAQGYLVAMIHDDGATDRYLPYRCTDQLGACTYTRVTDTGRKKTFKSVVRSTGTTYDVILNGKKHAAFKLGIYNIRTMQRQGNYWTKLKRIEN